MLFAEEMFGYFDVWARDGCPIWFVDLGWRFWLGFMLCGD